VTDLAISSSHVSKRFASHVGATSLKERILRRAHISTKDFWALRDVSVDILAGETVGLIGANGSGKSTLLKVLAGILRPTEGTVRSNGRIASLLELGAGFNSELSGRENIYLNASLLGLTRKETRSLLDEIIEFSELEEFIDGPVKHYSSGMYVRLGFAVAVNVDPEILLVDEVLAVGDEHFQRKCLDKISEFQDDGRTILFVSHSSGLVEQVCSRAVVLDHGHVMFDGDPYFASFELRKLLGTDVPSSKPDDAEHSGLVFGKVVFSNRAGGPPIERVAPGESLAIRVPVTIGEHWIGRVDHVRLVVMGVGDIPIWSMTIPAADLPQRAGDWALDFVVPECPPLRGRFVVAVQLSREAGQAIAAMRTSNAFEITGAQKIGLIKVDYVGYAEAGVVA
jgi:ABC-2 type transport system ATP-binding protein